MYDDMVVILCFQKDVIKSEVDSRWRVLAFHAAPQFRARCLSRESSATRRILSPDLNVD